MATVTLHRRLLFRGETKKHTQMMFSRDGESITNPHGLLRKQKGLWEQVPHNRKGLWDITTGTRLPEELRADSNAVRSNNRNKRRRCHVWHKVDLSQG